MSFTVTILGTSAATPTATRYMSAQLVNIGTESLLIDCAEGTQFQFIRLKLKSHKINHIFISHLHGDHFFGLVGLLSSMTLQNRKADVHIYAPKGLDTIITTTLQFSKSVLSFKVIFHTHPLEDSAVILDNPTLTVQTIPLNHRAFCRGFLIKEKPKLRKLLPDKLPEGLPYELFHTLKQGENVNHNGQLVSYEEVTEAPPKSLSFAYCSDTQYHEPLIPYIKEVDLLYHEATFMEIDKEKAVMTGHSTGKDAAKIAQQANAHQLILGHFSIRYGDLAPLLIEAKEVFENTLLAEEGSLYNLEV